ncbi:hypothetical protein RZS08_56035, partial [Arthrospira platensis SPKY1]|nr:hypothetical protein [Arthrospira platensis SPKY1]
MSGLLLNAKYALGLLFALPLLPLMAYQGKRAKASIPKLPEASGTAGCCATSPEAPHFRLIAIGESTIAGVGVRTHEEGLTGALACAIAEAKGVNVHWKVY